MAVGTVGVKGGANVIVPAQSLIKQTKEYTLTVTSGNAGWSTTRAVGIAYADSTGVWRLRFNVYGTFNQSATVTFTIANITTAAVRQAVAIYMEEVGTATRQNTGGFIEASSNVVYGATPAVNSTMITASGDVELASKPSWADASMEGVMPIAAYIPFGQAGMPGEVITWETAPATKSFGTIEDWSNAYLTLSKGTWLITASLQVFCWTATSNQSEAGVEAYITDSSNNIVQNQVRAFSIRSVANAECAGSGTIAISFIETIPNNSTVRKIRGAKIGNNGYLAHESNRWSNFQAIRLTP
jgi:hypothetical protein